MAEGATGILGTLRILVDADASKARSVIEKLGGTAQVVGGAIGASMGTAAIAGLRMGDTYDAALDGIRAATGATGAELERLEGIVSDVGSRVTEDIGIVGDAVVQLQRRTGAATAGTAESLVDLARLTETAYDATFDKVSQLYVNWRVAAEDQVRVNDMLLRAYQASGVGVDQLADSVDRNGAVLRAVGFTLEDSIALLAGLEQAGIDVNAVMGPLRKSLAAFAEEGKDPAESFRLLMDEIRNAPSDMDATQRAIDVFGARGAAMGVLIREGRLDVDALFDTIAGGSETVQKASDDTRDFADGWREMINSITTAVGPVTSVFAGISDALGNAIFLLPAIGGILGKAMGKVAQTSGAIIAKGLAGHATLSRLAGVGTVWGTVLGGAMAAAVIPILGILAMKAMEMIDELQGNVERITSQGAAIGAGALSLPEMETELEKVNAAILEIRRKIVAFPDTIFGGGFAVAPEFFGLTALEQYRDQLVQGIEDVHSGARDAIADPSARADYANAWDTVGAEVQAQIDKMLADLTPGEGPDVASPIRESFALATAEVAKGFGNIKAALANPPQLISKADRLENMEGRMAKVMGRIRAAVKAKDPVNLAYWETARANLQGKIDRLRDKHVSSLGEVKRAYRKAGVDMKGTMTRAGDAMERKSETTKNAIRSDVQGIIAAFQGVNLASAGHSMIATFASGAQSALGLIRSVVANAGQIIADFLQTHSPARRGPLSTLDRWGPGLIESWLSPMEGSEERVRRVGAKLANAIVPHPGMGRAMVGAAARGGGDVYQIGTLIADDGGIDALDRRMERRRRRRSRGGRRSNATT